jgi:hypothetical protein
VKSASARSSSGCSSAISLPSQAINLQAINLALSQFLDGTINVDDRQSAGIGNVPLRHRHLEAAFRRKAHRLQSRRQFADQVRHSRERRLSAETRDPLPRDCRVDQCRAPERLGQMDGALIRPCST